MPKPSEYQEKVREGNRMMVLSCIKDESKQFKELIDDTGLSPRGLTRILDELENKEHAIKRVIKGRWHAYELTKKGISLFSKAMTIGITIDQIQKEGGEYNHDYSRTKKSMGLEGLSWGIQDDVVINKKTDEKIGSVLEKIAQNTHLDIYTKFQNADLSKIKNGKVFLGFIIDIDDLIKSIKEKSVENYNKMNSKNKRKGGKLERAAKEFEEFEKI